VGVGAAISEVTNVFKQDKSRDSAEISQGLHMTTYNIECGFLLITETPENSVCTL